MNASRRDFLRWGSQTGLMASMGGLTGMHGIFSRPLSASSMDMDRVALRPEIEPLVRLIEITPREQCFFMMADQVRQGVPYRTFLAALFLAGIRNVNPQPPGFKFHCVFAIHSAHEISLQSAVQHRLLPLFWALDNFKQSQQQDIEQGDFELRPVSHPLPLASQAWHEFHRAMENWDEERADRAIVTLVRNQSSHAIIESLWQYGARDYRNIGHKAIFVANSWRTLQTIGWQHAEPVLRSLVLGLLDFKDETVNHYAYEDQSYIPNADRAKQILQQLPASWSGTEAEPAFTRELLNVLRTGNFHDASTLITEGLQKKQIQAGAVWDSIHLAAGELMIRQPGIYGIHTITSTHALRYAFQTSNQPETRLTLLLQGAGWICQFKNFMSTVPKGLGTRNILDLQSSGQPASPEATIESIFSLIEQDPHAAAEQTFDYAQRFPNATAYGKRARHLILTKGTDAHHYKYLSSIMEDYHLVNKAYRPHMLAASVYYICGSTLPDSPVMERAREALHIAG